MPGKPWLVPASGIGGVVTAAAIDSSGAGRVAVIARERVRRMLRDPRMLEIRLPIVGGLMACGAGGRKVTGGRRVTSGAILTRVMLHRRLRPVILIVALQTIGADIGLVRTLMTIRACPGQSGIRAAVVALIAGQLGVRP